MALTIREVFALLYPQAGQVMSSPATTSAKATDTPEIDFPMWFPDRSRDAPTEQQRSLARTAQRRLTRKIKECRSRWQEALNERYRIGYEGSGVKSRSAPLLPRRLDRILHLPARTPYDVFLISAYLLDLSGAYHHIQPERKQQAADCGRPDHDTTPDHIRHLSIRSQDREVVKAAAQVWREIPWRLILPHNAEVLATHLLQESVWPAIEPLFESWLVVFGAYGRRQVFERRPAEENRAYPAPGWWFHAWRLFAIADQASRGTGFQIDFDALLDTETEDSDKLPWFERIFWLNLLEDYPEETSNPSLFFDAPLPESFAFGRREIACVMPKVRTPTIGCTLRSLSHHLALLPSNGVARAKWLPSYERAPPHGQMNLLLVPFPYSIDAKAFCGSVLEQPDPNRKAQFGYFDVHQDWLTTGAARREELVTLVNDLIVEAKKQSKEVHGVIFPELALDLETHDMVRTHLLKTAPEIQLFVAGMSENQKRRKGNFVAVSSFCDPFDRKSKARVPLSMSVRDKHHRWKLDLQQLRSYGLLGVLSPEISWWENIDLLSRRVDFATIRKDMVISALICEDLARVDPCQLLLRAVAPHLVIALLMDAPQVATRWPARYATVLAEDPGCAVLTLTSRALMTRQHRTGVFRSTGADRYIAMWRDDPAKETTQIHCPFDAQAVLLTIVKGDTNDISLDGRTDPEAQAWRYAGHVPVRIPGARQKFAEILGEDDMACW